MAVRVEHGEGAILQRTRTGTVDVVTIYALPGSRSTASVLEIASAVPVCALLDPEKNPRVCSAQKFEIEAPKPK